MPSGTSFDATKSHLTVTWASLRAQESRLRPGGPSRKQCSTRQLYYGTAGSESYGWSMRLLSEELSKELSKTLSKADRNDAK